MTYAVETSYLRLFALAIDFCGIFVVMNHVFITNNPSRKEGLLFRKKVSEGSNYRAFDFFAFFAAFFFFAIVLFD